MEQNERDGMKLIAICREIDRDTGKVAVCTVNGELDDHALFSLKIRAALNPELRYFATTRAHFEGFKDIITSTLKRRTLTETAIARVGGLIEL